MLDFIIIFVVIVIIIMHLTILTWNGTTMIFVSDQPQRKKRTLLINKKCRKLFNF